MQKIPCVYIMTNRSHGVLYTGVTSDVVGRVYEHKQHMVKSFTKKYNLERLVYYELHEDMYSAITREKNIKNWKRQWKIELIEDMNPDWFDLYEGIVA
ncbi:MAG: GIY-YIG nuclease family protein [Proteobacteria bacterium]|nr:GIY-YIG nuclease family protein [Pseudomonadota bacterium]